MQNARQLERCEPEPRQRDIFAVGRADERDHAEGHVEHRQDRHHSPEILSDGAIAFSPVDNVLHVSSKVLCASLHASLLELCS